MLIQDGVATDAMCHQRHNLLTVWALNLILGSLQCKQYQSSICCFDFYYLISYDFRALQFFNSNAVALELFSIAYTL